MAPRRTNSRGGHARSISLADENAPVNSLVGPQRSKAALIPKSTRAVISGIGSSTSKDASHKSSSSTGGNSALGRKVLGDVSNAVKACVPNKSEVEALDGKIAIKPPKVRKVASQASLDHSDSSHQALSSFESSAATYGGHAGIKLAATLKNRASAQSLSSIRHGPKRRSISKPTSSSNPWANAAPTVLREEINEVEGVADSDEEIYVDRSEDSSGSTGALHDVIPQGDDDEMVIDCTDGLASRDMVESSKEIFAELEADNMASAIYDVEGMLEDEHPQHQSTSSSDENELSLCRNNVDNSGDAHASDNWLMLPPEEELECQQVIQAIRRDFQEELDFWDATMVAEYSEEIFKYMEELEESTLPNPRYMDSQTEIEWDMRTTLIDWLLQVHMRYHMLPETLWIAVNIIDRFLSKRVVSLVKFQLVGVTAMFVAAKYEEIMAPSVEEFVYMTENGYTRDEILKGEKILLTTLEFKISSYCSPYSWLRRISKADDYDIQTRTLSKFLMELTLLDHRFLRAKSSMIAAIGMYTARRMLGADWSDAFVFYSGYTEAQLITPMTFLIEFLSTDGFEDRFVYKKYANRKFLKASIFARNQALKRVREESLGPEP